MAEVNVDAPRDAHCSQQIYSIIRENNFDLALCSAVKNYSNIYQCSLKLTGPSSEEYRVMVSEKGSKSEREHQYAAERTATTAAFQESDAVEEVNPSTAEVNVDAPRDAHLSQQIDSSIRENDFDLALCSAVKNRSNIYQCSLKRTGPSLDEDWIMVSEKVSKSVTPEILLKLRCVFGPTFENALEIFEAKKVTVIYAETTKSNNKEKKINSFYEVKGKGAEVYTVFFNVNFCTCIAFENQVLRNKSTFTCKHVLAVWLASTGLLTMMTSDYKLIAKLGNLKTVIQLLRAVNFKEKAICYGSKNGLKITVEEGKCMQANAYIPVQLFEEFNLTEDIIFQINLNVLVECLSMFWPSINTQGSTVALEMHYLGVGHPVTILIEEDGIIVDCSLKTQDPDEILDFDLDPATITNKVLLQSELLKDVLAELDPSSNYLELLLSPTSPYFMISTKGIAGECHVQLPHNTELIESFQCKKEAKSKYLLSQIKPAMKAMFCSNKVSLRTNEAGLLCFQYMIKAEESINCFIEYYISPLLEDNDD